MSHTRTGSLNPRSRRGNRLVEHAPQNIPPHFRQWCWIERKNFWFLASLSSTVYFHLSFLSLLLSLAPSCSSLSTSTLSPILPLPPSLLTLLRTVVNPFLQAIQALASSSGTHPCTTVQEACSAPHATRRTCLSMRDSTSTG